ncbi:MAG: hypothetical protein AAF765_09130, partial [Bacteroidota bacterium]
MKTWFKITSVFFFWALQGNAQSNGEEVFSFGLLRQNDEVIIPSDEKKGLYKNLKQIKLGDQSNLSFGGSYRFQSEAFVNEEFASEVDQDDIWFLNRFLFHSHLHLSNGFELFVELNSSLITSKQNLAPVDKDELGFNQLFAR